MKIEKLEPSLCLAFGLAPEDLQYPVSILFGDVIELAILSRIEIENISEWDECVSIDVIDLSRKFKERRWRKRTL